MGGGLRYFPSISESVVHPPIAREVVGKAAPSPAAVKKSSSSSSTPLPSTNVGFKLLRKSGWKPGEPVNEGGVVEPIKHKGVNRSGRGLGAGKVKKERGKKERKRKVEKEQQREGGKKGRGLTDGEIRDMLRTDMLDADEILYKGLYK